MDGTAEDSELLLNQTQKEIFQRLLPGIICLVIFCAIGIVGNILTITFYAKRAKRSSTLIMIMSLAAVDLAVCVALILSIWEMAAIVTSYYSVVCKLTHFFGRWTVGSSCFVLWIVSIDRHRKICKPFGKQVTVSNAKRFVIGLVIFTLLLSIKEFLHYSSMEIQINVSNSNGTTTGYYCKELKGPGYRISITLFNAVDMILFVIIWVTQVVVYVLIIYSLVKIRLKIRRNANQSKPSNDIELERVSESSASNDKSMDPNPNTSNMPREAFDSRERDVDEMNNVNTLDLSDSMNNSTKCTDITWNSSEALKEQTHSSKFESRQPDVKKEEFSPERYPRCNKIVTTRQPNDQDHAKVMALTPMEFKLTVMLFAVSLVFVLCFTPYFVMVLWALTAGKEYELDAGIKFAIRLPFLNSVFNPIIYCIFNSEFRGYIKCLFTKRCRRSYS